MQKHWRFVVNASKLMDFVDNKNGINYFVFVQNS